LRLLLYTGKGGVGKTTTAAATAVHAARCGVKTLVLSTDGAHSLADVLDVPLGSAPGEVQPGLFAQQVDARARAAQSWCAVQEYLVGVLEDVGVDPLAAQELTALPGAEEVLALLEVRDQVDRGPWDLVVVDCAPTAETLRLLALPEVLSRALERMLPVDRRVWRALRRTRGATSGRPLPAPRDHVVEAAERLHAELAAAREVLTALATSLRLVLTPEAMVVAEARRTLTALSLHGFRVDGVVANRVLPSDGADPWRRGWAAGQREQLREVRDSFAPIPVRSVAYAPREPVGPTALASVGRELHGPAGPQAAERLLRPPDTPAPTQVERAGDAFVLTIDLPLAERRDVDLSRRADDLELTVGGDRRVLALPSALRRCRVAGASLRDGRLRVRFEPDPDLWRPM
jgi:arsenite-transporting ATPase